MSDDFQQNSVSAAIWPWQKSISGKVEVQPSLLVSLVTLVVGWTIGSLLYCYGHTTVAVLAFGISLFVFLAARFFPSVYSVVEQIFQRFSSVIGLTLTWIFLVPFFFICFPFGRMAQVLKRKDPMSRKLDPDTTSYWQSCDKTSTTEEYKRQF